MLCLASFIGIDGNPSSIKSDIVIVKYFGHSVTTRNNTDVPICIVFIYIISCAGLNGIHFSLENRGAMSKAEAMFLPCAILIHSSFVLDPSVYRPISAETCFPINSSRNVTWNGLSYTYRVKQNSCTSSPYCDSLSQTSVKYHTTYIL
jgi:hypothetical protein